MSSSNASYPIPTSNTGKGCYNMTSPDSVITFRPGLGCYTYNLSNPDKHISYAPKYYLFIKLNYFLNPILILLNLDNFTY